MKKLISFLATTTSTSLLFLGSLCASFTVDSLLLDIPEETVFPQNVRILTYPPGDLSTWNVLGLDQLKASGSGQFSEKGFSELVKALPLESEQLVICDLRAEHHGLVNGLPMCWIDELDSNDLFNQTAEEIELDEYRRLEVALKAGYLWVDQDPEQTEQVALVVSQVTTERALVEGLGHIYVRFLVTTGEMPNDRLVDQFVQFINCLSPDQWVHFHCRAGQQRTPLFLLLMDMIKNSHQVSLENILARHQLISGLHLKDSHSKENSSGWDEQEKFDFLSKFYVYCQQVSDFRIPWSEWIQHQLVSTDIHPSDEGKERKVPQLMQMHPHFPLLPEISIGKKLDSKRAISDVISDLFEISSDKSFRHGHKHSHGHKPEKHGHHHEREWKTEGTVTVKWGPDKDVTWDVSVGGETDDGNGNYVGGEVTHSSDGTGEARAYGGHDSKKK